MRELADLRVMGEAYFLQIASFGKVTEPELIRLSTDQFNRGYDVSQADGTVSHKEFELWEDFEDGTVDVIDPRSVKQ